MSASEEKPLAVTDGSVLTLRRDVGRFQVSLAEFSGNHRIPSHFHERACISLIMEGQFVQRFPGAEFVVPPGGLLGKPPEERHEDRWCGVRTQHIIVEPDPEHAALGPLARAAETIGFRIDPWALGLGRRMACELRNPDDATELALEALALELLVRLHRTERAPRGGSAPAWLERIRECLHDRHGERIVLGDLAAEAGVHPSQLTRQFRAHYGSTPADYLRHVRLQAVMRELAAGNKSITQVALRHGFSDQSHLTRWLKRTTGLTPAVYRTTAFRDARE